MSSSPFYASFCLIFLALYFSLVCAKYQVTVQRVNQQKPVISSQKGNQDGGSIFEYNYNAAFMPSPSSDQKGGLLVRCQNSTGATIYDVGPSVISYVPLASAVDDLNNIEFDFINLQDVVIEPNGPMSSFGTEDPRAAYNSANGNYYILYSAVENKTGIPISRLSLRVTNAAGVSNPNSYVDYGPLFPQVKWSKSGALLIRESGPSYLIWGDSTIENGLQLATTQDLIHYVYNDTIFLPIRPNSFDSMLVEAGPMPLPLSDGNYLFLYNSARHGYPSKKPNWDVQYNVGFLILDKNDPSNILQRSDEPILSPELDWEIGNDSKNLGLTPNVVFVEGWTPLSKPDTFLIFYGAADSVIGAAVVSVVVP